jgi:hypothetical protein
MFVCCFVSVMLRQLCSGCDLVMLDFQNTCLLPNNKLGIEFIEYNFHFFRDCDE